MEQFIQVLIVNLGHAFIAQFPNEPVFKEVENIASTLEESFPFISFTHIGYLTNADSLSRFTAIKVDDDDSAEVYGSFDTLGEFNAFIKGVQLGGSDLDLKLITVSKARFTI